MNASRCPTIYAITTVDNILCQSAVDHTQGAGELLVYLTELK